MRILGKEKLVIGSTKCYSRFPANSHPNMARYPQLRCSIGSTGFARWKEGTATAVLISGFQSPPTVSSSM